MYDVLKMIDDVKMELVLPKAKLPAIGKGGQNIADQTTVNRVYELLPYYLVMI